MTQGLSLLVPVWPGRGWRPGSQQEEATRTRLTRVWSHSTQQGGGQGREEEWGPHGSGGGETQIVRGHATLVSAWTKLFSWDSPLGLRGLVSVPLSGGPFSPFNPRTEDSRREGLHLAWEASNEFRVPKTRGKGKVGPRPFCGLVTSSTSSTNLSGLK